MIAERLGELDKPGVAELTFKDRDRYSGNRVQRTGVRRASLDLA